MLFTILKKDLQKRMGVNVILFLFITLATVFLASNVNNIMVVRSAVDYYMEYADVPDFSLLVNGDKEKADMAAYLKKQKQTGKITAYAYNYLHTLPEKAIQVQKGGRTTKINTEGCNLYLGTTDSQYAKAFDEAGKGLTLKQGEIAVSPFIMKKNNLHLQDILRIETNGKSKAYRIKTIMKDVTFGNDMAGMTRFILNEQDFAQYKNSFQRFYLFYVNTENTLSFQQQLQSQGYQTLMNIITKDTYQLMYSMDMIVAGLLIVIGICLILIALLVLRFTLVFTMEEQYQEIGVLKAIGLRPKRIRRLYLLKYFFLVMIGAGLGAFLSIPISSGMIASVSENMIMESSETNIGINCLCAFLIVFLVLSFCYVCTRKMKHISAVSAIQGHIDERSGNKHGFTLSKYKYMPVCVYLSLQDICMHMRRYIVLIITFCISFLLITIPLNTLKTMNSTQMLKKFGLDPQSAVYLKRLEREDENVYTSYEEVEKGMMRLQKELRSKGYDTKLAATPLYFLTFYDGTKKQKLNLMCIQPKGAKTEYLEYEEGTAPVLENEIAVSKPVLKANGWKIGDTLYVQMQAKERVFMITGSYSDYMQLGNSVRLNSKVHLSQPMLGYWSIMVYLDTQLSQQELADKLSKELPTYEWISGQELINRNIGGVQDTLKQFVVPMTAMLCGVIMLITLLMERLFITREKGEIAMMKACGFTQRSIIS